MGIKHTKALRKRWAGKSPEQRSKHASMMATKRIERMSDRQRKRIGRALTDARLEKQNA